MVKSFTGALRKDLTPVDDLSPYLDDWLSRLQSKQFNPQTCEVFLRNLLKEIADIDVRFLSPELSKERWQSWLTQFFELRSQLSAKWGKFAAAETPVSETGARLFRRTLNQLRAIEDRLILWQENPRSFDPRHDPVEGPFLQGKIAELMTTFPDRKVRIRSGDLLLTRANVFLSSVLARMTEEQGFFSHAVIIYIDAPAGTELTVDEALQSPNAYVVEAHGKSGSSVRSFRSFANEGYVKIGLFRSQIDAPKAHQAAESIHHLVTDHAEKNRQAAGHRKVSPNHKIPYDYSLNMQDRSTLFCSELVARAYESIGVSLPTFQSKLRENYVLRLMSVQASRIFAPLDVDIDPHFQIIAEWRDIRKLNNIVLVDYAFDAAFRWVEEKGYVAHLQPMDKLLGYAIWKIRQWDLGFTNEFQKHVPHRFLALAYIMDRVGTALLTHLKNYVEQHRILNSGHLPSDQEIREELERFRAKDAAAYAASESSFFHRDFRPQKI